uniref:Uncharacterized protein n=1 Tax=Panagrolaimus superbus TaxID=310955 RepID=A0A914YTT2_9BILA
MLKKSVPPKKVEEVQKLSSTKTAILKESPPKRKSKEKKKNRKRKTQKKEEINESSNKSEKPKSKPPSIIELGKEQQQQPKPDESPKKGHERMAPSQGTDDSKNDKSSTVLSTTIMINVEDGSSKVNQSESQKRNGSEIKSIKSLTNFPEI